MPTLIYLKQGFDNDDVKLPNALFKKMRWLLSKQNEAGMNTNVQHKIVMFVVFSTNNESFYTQVVYLRGDHDGPLVKENFSLEFSYSFYIRNQNPTLRKKYHLGYMIIHLHNSSSFSFLILYFNTSSEPIPHEHGNAASGPTLCLVNLVGSNILGPFLFKY